MTEDSTRYVWIFVGKNASFPSGVFTSKVNAQEWIIQNRLEGVLTRYPVDIPVYDWAIKRGTFSPRKDKHHYSEFIASFSSASQEHYHYEIIGDEYRYDLDDKSVSIKLDE